MTWRPGTPLRLETKRCTIRSLQSKDVTERFVQWFGRPEVMKYVAIPQGEAGARALQGMLRTADHRTRFLLGAFERESNRIVAFLKLLYMPRFLRMQPSLVIGDPEDWGKHFAQELMAAVVDFGFDVLQMNKVVYHVYADNERVVRLFESRNVHFEGRHRDHERRADGSYRDVLVYSSLRSERAELRGTRPKDISL